MVNLVDFVLCVYAMRYLSMCYMCDCAWRYIVQWNLTKPDSLIQKTPNIEQILKSRSILFCNVLVCSIWK